MELDITWLEREAGDDATRKWIVRAAEWRREARERNILPGDDHEIVLHLGNHEIWVHACATFSLLEVYQEIFRDRDHCLAPGFDGRNANLVVDIGANYGLYALKISKNNPRSQMICLEPNPYVFPLLRKNLSVNNVHATALQQALDSTSGVLILPIIRQLPAISGSGLYKIERGWLKSEFMNTVEVPAVSLSEVWASQGKPIVDILKIDVEGMETRVLEPAEQVMRCVRRVVVERHSMALRDRVLELLTGFGFELLQQEDPECRRYYGDMYFANRNMQPMAASGVNG